MGGPPVGTRTPIDRIRVKNGYGIRTSALSTSVIGRFDASSDKRKATNREWERLYDADAKFQMSQLEGTHPVRKVLHMQSCYPETIRLLSDKERTVSSAYGRRAKNQTSRSGPFPAPQPPISSRWIRGPPHKAQSSSFAANSSKGEDASDQIRRRAAHEYDFCHRKMAHNRAKGHEARVDGILTGTSPLTANIPLFPAHATHQQLSGLVRRPSYPDRPAPVVPRERKWLGDSVGWEGNRGLPTPPAGRNARDGEVWPWPSSQFPSLPVDSSLA